jgi:hypothetical protein
MLSRNLEHHATPNVTAQITAPAKGASMLKPFLTAASIAWASLALPVVAQQSPSPEQPPAQQVDPGLVGLPVYSSDGQKLGQVAEAGMSQGQPAVRAELGEFLGLGSTSVIIDSKLFAKKDDRIEIAMTADEVKSTITKQREQRKQP